jgi:hypothetical protein
MIEHADPTLYWCLFALVSMILLLGGIWLFAEYFSTANDSKPISRDELDAHMKNAHRNRLYTNRRWDDKRYKDQ